MIPPEAFLNFLTLYQGENLVLNDAKALIQLHEPCPDLRANFLLSFEGFVCYLLDGDNSAIHSDPLDENLMNEPLSHYYIASSHNTYLTGHQLKGQSSVELYRQVRLRETLGHKKCIEFNWVPRLLMFMIQ